jgi:nucleotide-binding universal stress UspA family protein
MSQSASHSFPWRHVLVTTDLSPAAEPAFQAAAELARRAQARVTMLHVIDLVGLGDSWSLRESLAQLQRDFLTEVRPRLETLGASVFEDLPLEIAFVEGLGAADMICRYACEHAADLIAIATHGNTGLKRFLVGSVAERVVQGAHCDVIVVRSESEARRERLEIQRILVPTDFSKPADQALERAVHLARLTDAEIHLLHAYELPTAVGALDAPLALPQDFFDQIRDSARKQLDQRLEAGSAAGVEGHAHLTVDTPARAILDAAAKIAADLIVMGTHGHTGMKHVLLGSVAERTVRLASCPVMTVKAAG